MMKLLALSFVTLAIIYMITPPTEFPNRLEKITKSTINNSFYDLEQFSTTWNVPDSWSEGLHIINPTRLKYILGILEMHKVPKNVKILDLGCGGGLLSSGLAKHGYTGITGMDISPNSIKEAKKASIDMKIDYKVGSAYEIPEKEGVFDVIIMADVLEHLDDLKLAMTEVDRVLKKGGLIFFETIDRNFYSNLFVKVLAETFGVTPKNTHDYRLFIKPDELRELFSYFHFQFIEFFGYNFKFGFASNLLPTIKSAYLLPKGEWKDLYIGYGKKKP